MLIDVVNVNQVAMLTDTFNSIYFINVVDDCFYKDHY